MLAEFEEELIIVSSEDHYYIKVRAIEFPKRLLVFTSYLDFVPTVVESLSASINEELCIFESCCF